MINTTAFRSLAWAVAVLVAWVALVFVAISLGSRQQTTPAQAQYGASTDRIPISDTFFSCTGEGVLVQGTLHTVSHTFNDANGGFHTKFQFNLKGQGEGALSGDKYVFHHVFNDHLNASTGPLNRTLTQTVKFIRQGSDKTTPADDVNSRLVIHVTVNANGEVTTEFVKFEDEPCT
jgi:hypothetical protein